MGWAILTHPGQQLKDDSDVIKNIYDLL